MSLPLVSLSSSFYIFHRQHFPHFLRFKFLSPSIFPSPRYPPYNVRNISYFCVDPNRISQNSSMSSSSDHHNTDAFNTDSTYSIDEFGESDSKEDEASPHLHNVWNSSTNLPYRGYIFGLGLAMAVDGWSYISAAGGGSLSNSLVTLARLCGLAIGDPSLNFAMAGNARSHLLGGFYRSKLQRATSSFCLASVKDGATGTANVSSTPNAQPATVASQLVTEIKERLAKEYSHLPVGKNGRDDEGMILWFLKDRKFSVEDTISKLTKAIRWRHEFGVSELSEESVRKVAESGKAYVHDYLDIHERPVLIVDTSKHFPGMQESVEDEKLCAFMIEKALRKLPAGKHEILGIIDLREFGPQNADIKFIAFVFDAFYCYYPRRLGQVLFVDAPFIFKPIWLLIKPLLKSYASLVKFCSAEDVRKEYFNRDTVPSTFRQ